MPLEAFLSPSTSFPLNNSLRPKGSKHHHSTQIGLHGSPFKAQLSTICLHGPFGRPLLEAQVNTYRKPICWCFCYLLYLIRCPLVCVFLLLLFACMHTAYVYIHTYMYICIEVSKAYIQIHVHVAVHVYLLCICRRMSLGRCMHMLMPGLKIFSCMLILLCICLGVSAHTSYLLQFTPLGL